MLSHEGAAPVQPMTEKPYHSKRPHRKSRTGCRNCKTRKVKCDEVRPSCRNCTLRREDCTYPNPPSSARSDSTTTANTRSSRSTSSPRYADDRPAPLLLREPCFVPAEKDETDMRCLWFYMHKTHKSSSSDVTKSSVLEILRFKVVQLAFQSPFLMDTILSLTAQHMKYLNTPISEERALAYRARAFKGYRQAIESGNPAHFNALLPASLFMCAVASTQFREEGASPLYILDWILVWRGIGMIFDLVRPETVHEAGVEPLFSRPPVDLNTAALHIPGNLLYMVTSIRPGDEDFPNVDTYYDTLKYLGALYQELSKNGYGPVLDLRIITFFTFLRPEFVGLARERKPRALVIVAHYLAFAKTIRAQSSWWMLGIADRQLGNICSLLDDAWAPLLSVPRGVARTEDRDVIARMLLNNFAWQPPQPEDVPLETCSKIVGDWGAEIANQDGLCQVATGEKPGCNEIQESDGMKNLLNMVGRYRFADDGLIADRECPDSVGSGGW